MLTNAGALIVLSGYAALTVASFPSDYQGAHNSRTGEIMVISPTGQVQPLLPGNTANPGGISSPATQSPTINVDAKGNTLIGDGSSSNVLTAPENAAGHAQKHLSEFP